LNQRVDVRAIKERADIVAIISRYVSLSKSGANYKGRCPFHKDDTPSMTVSAEKGLWHCFGCGEGGDVIAFLMKIERLSFVEAMKRLAAEVGLSFSAREDGQRETLRAITTEAARHFAANLAAPPGERARVYLLDRGYGEDVWKCYGLGYALPGWENVKRTFVPRYGEEVLLELGLLVQGKGGKTYDRFRDRVMFPILDLGGRPVAFGGRAFDGEPKYLNSPKTPLFDKGRLLYGLSWAREALAQKRSAVLVEGYTDVLTLHRAGITNAVGSMGTSLTEGQAALLGRFTEEVVIAYDQDAAGGAAALRGMQILRNYGLAVRVAQLPRGDDPDGLVRREGAEAMEDIVQRAVPFYRFFVERLVERHDVSTLPGKERFLDDARELYTGIINQPLANELVKEIADALDLYREDVRRQMLKRPDRDWTDWEETRTESELASSEEVLLALLLREDIAWDRISEVATPEAFSAENRPIIEALSAGTADVSEVIDHLDEEASRRASFYALAPIRFSDKEKAVEDALSRLVRIPEIERRLADLDQRLEACETARDWEEWNRLTKEKVALLSRKLRRKGTHDDEEAEG